MPEVEPPVHPVPSVNPSLYGYFNAETFSPAAKEFNLEYDPYLQKLADNPNKPKVPPIPIPTDFSSGKKKKKRYCEICEVCLTTVPAFQAHMTSPAHIYKLKTLGMGVSAHFVKASSDLHTTDLFVPGEGEAKFHCDSCDMVLNSKSQYDAHLAGKAHTDKLKKKVMPPNVLTCYTCNVQLAGIRVFNDHKNGRKHRKRCMMLVRNGYTIPAEERPADMVSRSFPEPPRYPELYVKEVLSKMNVDEEKVEEAVPEEPPPEQLMPPPPPPPPKPDVNMSTGLYHCTECPNRFTTAAKLQLHLRSIHPVVSEEAPPAVPGTEPVVLPVPEIDYECGICMLTFKDSSPFHSHLISEEHVVKVWELAMSGVPLNAIISELTSMWNFNKPCNGKYYCWLCNVLSNNQGENKLHLEGSLHKATEKAQTKEWRMILVESVARQEDGTFNCKLCEQSFPTLVQFNAHVISNAHLGKKNQDRKRRFIEHALRMNEAKNPGFRTKIPGLATDVETGVTERVPNLEPLEPKIDESKNVNLGITLPAFEPKKQRMNPPSRRPWPRYPPCPPLFNQHRGPRAPRPFGPPRFNQNIPPGPWNSNGMFEPYRFQKRASRPGNWGPYNS